MLVPLHPWSHRRYNQSPLLVGGGRGITPQGCLVPPDMLVHRRNTLPHRYLSCRARDRYVRCGLKARARQKVSLQGKTVILIGALLTTGATVEACTRASGVGGTAKIMC